MKRLALLIGLVFFCYQVVLADEIQIAKQNQIIEDNKAVVMVQKQPTDEKSVQKQDVKRNWFCIVVQVNGKIIDRADK